MKIKIRVKCDANLLHSSQGEVPWPHGREAPWRKSSWWSTAHQEPHIAAAGARRSGNTLTAGLPRVRHLELEQTPNLVAANNNNDLNYFVISVREKERKTVHPKIHPHLMCSQWPHFNMVLLEVNCYLLIFFCSYSIIYYFTIISTHFSLYYIFFRNVVILNRTWY